MISSELHPNQKNQRKLSNCHLFVQWLFIKTSNHLGHFKPILHY